MQENIDRADFIFFKSRIDSLNIEPTYTQRLFSIFDKALIIFDRIENDLELQYLLCLSIWNELSITPVFNDADRIMYFIGIQKDVTETVDANTKIRELEEEIANLRAQLARQQ